MTYPDVYARNDPSVDLEEALLAHGFGHGDVEDVMNIVGPKLARLREENEVLGGYVERLQHTAEKYQAQRDTYLAALREIATKARYGCCSPLYPDSPICSHNIARTAISEVEEGRMATDEGAKQTRRADEAETELSRLREALEIIANQGPGAVKAYNDPLRGVPATGDRMRLLARNALKETT